MGSDWSEYSLGEIIVTNDSTYSPKEAWDFVNYLDTSSITENRVTEIQSLDAKTEKVPSRARRKVSNGDIVYSNVRPNQKHYGLIRNQPENFLVSTGFTTIRADPDVAETEFLYWYISQPQITELLQGIGENTASAYPSIKPSDIEKLQISLPPLPEQKAIAHILGTLDDKIELNRRMNATLEGMAQALFKSWFVDFDPVIDNALAAGNPIPDELAPRAEVRRQALANGTANREAAKPFPDSFQETEELGLIPEGWEVNEIENSTSTIIDHRGKTPKKLGHDWAKSGIPAVSAKNIKNGKLVRRDSIKFTDTALYERWMAEELQKGDVLMTSEAPLGEKLYLAKQVKWVLSQRLFALRANDQISGVYLYHWLNTDIAKADIDGRASGTTVQGIRQSELRKVKVLTPDENSIGAFSNTCDALMEKRAINEENTERLISLRDTLLPKLISGELRISDAEQLTEEALT